NRIANFVYLKNHFDEPSLVAICRRRSPCLPPRHCQYRPLLPLQFSLRVEQQGALPSVLAF
ncbi:MAG TPA: hypothetical protein VIH54_09395, partial [Chthoniobacterales bacterium]